MTETPRPTTQVDRPGPAGGVALHGTPTTPRRPRLVFLYPGPAAVAAGMGRAVYDAEPAVRVEVDAALAALPGPLGDRVRAALLGPPGRAVPPDCAAPALFVLEYALTRLLVAAGLNPDTVLGYGVGEVTAACVAGVLDPADALHLATAYGRLSADLPPAATMTVGLPAVDVTRQLPPEVRLVAVDTPESCVVAGPGPELRRWERTLAQLYVTCHRPAAPVAAYPDDVPSRLGPVVAALPVTTPRPPRIRWLSTVSGRPVSADEAVDREHWLRLPGRPVRFAEAAGQLADRDVAVEVGPGSTLTALLRHATPDLPALSVLPPRPEREPTDPRRHPDPVAAVRALLADPASRRDRPHLPDHTRAGTPRPGRRK
ncbi:acyltransferase domain-containing protein [Micromonospora halophytica]|uniref:Acyl transferase domain-containing protein n=1 Tax=Micromonospora halophytica TaxID=47864 RepID=A0A1C5I956_9ACTN|nr:acyltransferase domain-containing protein [Micromonospora halophytica]SCG54266.1 Acyl transferase domain-containing protein [Micromonospora halophytica]